MLINGVVCQPLACPEFPQSVLPVRVTFLSDKWLPQTVQAPLAEIARVRPERTAWMQGPCGQPEYHPRAQELVARAGEVAGQGLVDGREEPAPRALGIGGHGLAALLRAQHPLHPAEGERCLPARLCRLHSQTKVFLRLHLDVEAQLALHLALAAGTVEEGAQPLAGFGEESHAKLSVQLSTPFTAEEDRSHSARSCSNCRRPAGVSS